MSILLEFINASSLKQLPKVARDCFESEEEFVDLWVCKNDAEKTELIGMCLCDALFQNIKTDKQLVKFLAYYIIGLTDDYEKPEDEEEKQEVIVPVIQQPNDELLKLQEENTKLTQKIRRLENKPEPKEKRGRGRPPKCSTQGEYKCVLCEICMSSHGSLHNHYDSKSHEQKVMSVLNQSKEYVEKGLHTKIIVKVRSHLKDPNFTKENPDMEYLDTITDFVKCKENPIIDILLVKGEQKENNWVSWKKLC
jgi:hypothetical protein